MNIGHADWRMEKNIKNQNVKFAFLIIKLRNKFSFCQMQETN